MSNVTAKWRSFVTLLLCVFILAASVDRLPDPPALKPHSSEAKANYLIDPVDRCCDRDGKWARFLAASLVIVHWLDFRTVYTTGRPVDAPKLVRQASDSSPPHFSA